MKKSFETLCGQIGLKIQIKLIDDLEKNDDQSRLKKISYISFSTEDIERLNGFLEDSSSRDSPYFKYTPITSVVKEPSFPAYQTL